MRWIRLLTIFLKRANFEYRLLLWHVTRRLRKSVTVKTKQGVFKLPLSVDDPISRSLFVRKRYELEFAAGALSLLRETEKWPTGGGGTVLDVGANNGVISIGMLVAGGFEKAIAIEPEPANFSCLRYNVKRNNLEEKFVCLNQAVSDAKAMVELELSKTNRGDHRVRKIPPDSHAGESTDGSKTRIVEVPSDRLDDLLTHVEGAFTRDIRLVWVDVQGFEGYVFLGARNLLSKGVPVVSEIWPRAIQQAGMSRETFCKIAGEIWSAYWVKRRNGFVKYPIGMLGVFFDELGYGDDFDNVIFTS